ncbi:MAG: ABC transporter substrate-binding protein [Sporichthyaceae bacterium]
MRTTRNRRLAAVAPIAVSAALVLTACGSGSDSVDQAQAPAAATQAEAPNEAAGPAAAPAAEEATEATAEKPAAAAEAAAPKAKQAAKAESKTPAKQAAAEAPTATKTKTAKSTTSTTVKSGATTLKALDTAAEAAANAKIAEQKNGATDVGVTSDSIKMGTVSMHGMALGNVLVGPIVRGINGYFSSVNDQGGVLGRRLSLVDCDDGPGEISRTKACIKKLATVDRIFSLLNITSWGAASAHDDLKQLKLPSVGQWAYSQTEWQDPYMFPTHMSMIHEAMAGANWARNVVKPKTYGLVCLTSPEMQLACNEVKKILDASGSKLVKRADVAISETSMSSHVLAMRAANPEHIIHYVINPATMAKFIVESSQQNYWPSKGISGNHLAAEVLGSLFGKHPVGRYWTNTTYKMWGPEFIATMNKYARANRGTNHHIVQATYVGAQFFVQAAKAIGPNLTRERLMAQLGNGDVYSSEASMDQRFMYTNGERYGNNWNKNYGQGREFMYKYVSSNTTANPDGSPNGFAPDEDQFEIYTWK